MPELECAKESTRCSQLHGIYEHGTCVTTVVFSVSGTTLCQKMNFLRALSMCCRYVRQVCLTCLSAKLRSPGAVKFMIFDIGIDIHWEIWSMANFVSI